MKLYDNKKYLKQYMTYDIRMGLVFLLGLIVTNYYKNVYILALTLLPILLLVYKQNAIKKSFNSGFFDQSFDLIEFTFIFLIIILSALVKYNRIAILGYVISILLLLIYRYRKLSKRLKD